jgi:hypothetical protein
MPPGSARPFEPRRDVHTIAENVAVLDDYLALVDADPELNAVIRRDCRVPLGDALLHLDRASNRINDAGELDEHAVTGVLDDPAAVSGDGWIDHLAEKRPEPFVRTLLINPHQTRVAGHIGG